MNYIYGEVNQKVEKNTYKGISTPTADVVIDNSSNTIAVNAHADTSYVENLINKSIDTLDYKDSSHKNNTFVKDVQQENGLISAKYAPISLEDLPTLSIDNIINLRAALEKKQDSLEFKGDKASGIITDNYLKDQLATLEGALRYLGESSTNPFSGIITINSKVIVPKNGDIVTFNNSKQEFVYISDTWVSEYNGKCIITCTSSDYNYFIENYKYENLQLLDGIEYNCLQGLFDKYTGEFYSIKQNSKGGVKSWAKLNLNGVYGKFGQNIIAEFRKDEYNKELNCIDDIIVRNDDGTIELISEGVYIPVASFVTSYSRIHLLSILNIINDTKGIQWRYCDTDSAYVTGDVNILKKALAHVIDFEDSGQLGLWKIEKYFDKILIIGIKKYIYFGGKDENANYSYHATLSGINNKYFKFIEDYCNIDENCICEISEEDRNFVNAVNEYINFKDGKSDKKNVKEVNYYVSRETNNPFIYKDKECTQMVKGAYRSIRKKTVKNGQILFNTIYCIKGELK